MKYTASTPWGAFGALLLMIGIVVGAPLATIGAINTLFSTHIEYTFTTWLSVVWLHVIMGHLSARSKSDE